MNHVINLKKRKKIFLLGRKEVIVILVSIVLTTLSIKAADDIITKSAEVKKEEGACPEGMALVLFSGGNFCIDKYEASAGVGCSFLNPAVQSETRENLDKSICAAVSVSGAMPWRNISQNQAALACAKAGKRLPTNKEWLQASLGTPDKSANWGKDDCQVAKNWGDVPGKSGSGKNCVSSAGVYDMIGNVWEWVEGAVYDGSFENRPLPSQGYIKSVDENAMPNETDAKSDPNYFEDYLWIKDKGTRGIARGGYWDNKSDAGLYSVHIVTLPSFAGEGIGFRCVK